MSYTEPVLQRRNAEGAYDANSRPLYVFDLVKLVSFEPVFYNEKDDEEGYANRKFLGGMGRLTHPNAFYVEPNWFSKGFLSIDMPYDDGRMGIQLIGYPVRPCDVVKVDLGAEYHSLFLSGNRNIHSSEDEDDAHIQYKKFRKLLDDFEELTKHIPVVGLRE